MRRAHLVVRLALPYADPYLLPLVAVLASFGLVMIYNIDEDLARDQATWFVVGVVIFAGAIVLLRDYRVLERYRYTIALRRASCCCSCRACRASARRSTARTSA